MALNKALNHLLEWAKSNYEMLVNPEKSEFQQFTFSSKQYPHLSLVYNSTNLPCTSCTTYLRVQLEYKLQWSKHIDELAHWGEKRLSLLRKLARTKWGAYRDILTQAYTANVRPVLEYGNELLVGHCGIAGNEEADKLAKQGSEKPQPQTLLEYWTIKRLLMRCVSNMQIRSTVIENKRRESSGPVS